MNEVKPQRDPLTQLVIGAAIEVHREMGPGLLSRSIRSASNVNSSGKVSLASRRKSARYLVYKGETIDAATLSWTCTFPGNS